MKDWMRRLRGVNNAAIRRVEATTARVDFWPTPSAVMAAPKIVTHTTMRQRRDGNRPSGNNSIKNTPRVGFVNPIHVDNHATDSPQGSVKFSSRALSAYATVQRCAV